MPAPANADKPSLIQNADALCPSGDCRLTLEIFILNNMIMRLGDKLVGHLGLTSSRWLLISALSRFEDPPTISELSKDALLSLQNVSRMVAAMEADGFVERITRPGHGRATFVKLTALGDHVVEQTMRIGGAFSEQFHMGLSEQELDAMQGSIQKLFANLSRMEQGPGAILDRAKEIVIHSAPETNA